MIEYSHRKSGRKPMNLRVVFMGSPEFSLPSLRLLAENYPVVGVFTQPDQPAGRGRTLTPPPVKLLAQKLNIPVYQHRKLKNPDAVEELRNLNPNLIVVAAFGQILNKDILDIPLFGCINVHASLLPRWRGAAPIQAAILNGDEKTGASIIIMATGVDTGPILNQRPVSISPDDTAGSLSNRLAQVGAELLIDTLPAYLEGDIKPRSQDEFKEAPTYAPMLKKADGLLDFTQPAEALERQVRAFHPWPGSYFDWYGSILKIQKARCEDDSNLELPPGKTLIHDNLPAVAANPGILILEEIQPQGKKAMDGAAFLLGARHWA
jgi:methionyl-tRNA formyltransferase